MRFFRCGWKSLAAMNALKWVENENFCGSFPFCSPCPFWHHFLTVGCIEDNLRIKLLIDIKSHYTNIHFLLFLPVLPLPLSSLPNFGFPGSPLCFPRCCRPRREGPPFSRFFRMGLCGFLDCPGCFVAAKEDFSFWTDSISHTPPNIFARLNL